jgi:hypothetical protein
MVADAPEHGSNVNAEGPHVASFPWVGMALAVALVWVAAAVAFWLVRSEEGGLFALGLLGIPAAGSCCVVAKYGARSRFLNSVAPPTLLLVLFEAVFLGAYTFHAEIGRWVYPTVSAISLVAAGAIVVGSLGLAAYLIRPEAEAPGHGLLRGNGLIRSLSGHPFAAICFFFTAFCFVASYLSFGLAFHDQGLRARGRAQSASGEGSGREPTQADPAVRTGLHAALVPAAAQRSQGPGSDGGSHEVASPHRTWRIRFPRGAAKVSYDRRYQNMDPDDVATLEDDALRLRAENASELDGLVEEIASHGDRARVRVLLVGHADDTPLSQVNPDYPSNFELSEARTYQVMAEVVRRLEPRSPGWRQNVEWLLLPFSSEETFLDPETEYLATAEEARLMVEVAVMPGSRSIAEGPAAPAQGRPLELLDYIYFTIYTITTTGYGDIVPVSAFAKFTTSLANLFEVMFTVIFFNVLVSFLRDGHHRPPATAAPPSA